MHIAFYKGTRPGFKGLYNRLVRFITGSQYSHCELVFSDQLSASSSFEDGGVRFKDITFDTDRWDVIALPHGTDEFSARQWFLERNGAKYDLLGNLHIVIREIPHSRSRYFCSEAIAAALGIARPERYTPGRLFDYFTLSR